MSIDVLLVDFVGLLSIAAIVWYFFLSRRPDEAAAQDAGGVQEVRVLVKGGYSPDRIVARTGVPLRLHFHRQEESPCSEEVVFPDFGVRRHLPAFATTTIDLPAKPAGSYGFACGMDMLHGTLVLGESGLDHVHEHAHGEVAPRPMGGAGGQRVSLDMRRRPPER